MKRTILIALLMGLGGCACIADFVGHRPYVENIREDREEEREAKPEQAERPKCEGDCSDDERERFEEDLKDWKNS